MSRYLVDTSALGTHYLGQLGDGLVADCLREGADICALTVFEFSWLLRRHGVPATVRAASWSLYRGMVHGVRAVDEGVAVRAVALREESKGRIPLADACIAACAVHHGLVLVHADNHFKGLPSGVRSMDVRSHDG